MTEYRHRLSRPLALGPRVITELALREVTAKDLVRFSANPPNLEPFDATLRIISMLSGVDERVLEDKLCARDFIGLSERAAEIFRDLEEAP